MANPFAPPSCQASSPHSVCTRVPSGFTLAAPGDAPMEVAACELILEALVARRKLSRSDGGEYVRAPHEQRRRPGHDMGGGLSA